MIWRVEWQHVSAVRYPQFYAGDYPTVKPLDVPDQFWTTVHRESNDEQSIRTQFEGLQQLIIQNELIRNVKLFSAPGIQVDWQRVA